MNRKQYWRQRIPWIILNLICMMALSVFLHNNGIEIDSILLIVLVWILILSIAFWKLYVNQRSSMEKLLAMTEQLSDKYLISEIMEKPIDTEGQVYYHILKMANRSMLEKIGEIEGERKEYKEYIEQWVHEIKTPIAAMKLLCENHRSEIDRELLVQIEKVNHFVEQALYYARSEHTEKDYSIREIHLTDVIHQAIAENKYLLLKHGIRVEILGINDVVYSDEKWINFILNQLIVNAVKYQTEYPVFIFRITREQNQVNLSFLDNGIGIDPADLPRIFEKGFTGKNGRIRQGNATGMGLYLCKKLCNKLGIKIQISSDNNGTEVLLSFLVNDFMER